MDNSTFNCSTNINNRAADNVKFLLISNVLSAISICVCLVTIVLICRLKLHRTLVYRLGIYQVIFAIVFSASWVICDTYTLIVDQCFYDDVHRFLRALVGSSGTLNPTFTACMMTHLFVFTACHKNFKRLEPLYVVTPFLVMVIMIAPLLLIGLYENVYYEYMYACVAISVFAGLGILPSIATMVVLCYRSCRRKNDTLLDHSKQYRMLLREMLPLLIYPIWSFVYITILVVEIFFPQCSNTFCWRFTAASSPTAWSLLAAALLLVHVGLVLRKRISKRQREVGKLPITNEEGPTAHYSTIQQRSDTAASLPPDE